MAKTFWFSCDQDTGEVVAKTEIKENGSVRRYEYTEPDNIKKGHGDRWYDNVEKFMNDDFRGERRKESSKSINRPWKGNGHTFNPQEFIEEEILEETIEFTKILKLY